MKILIAATALASLTSAQAQDASQINIISLALQGQPAWRPGQ